MIASLCFDPLPLYLAVRDHPSLSRSPLVSVEEERVTHANAAARRHGITPGMRLDGARMRVEGLEVADYTEPDLDHAWSELLRDLTSYTPWVESPRRGRAFVRIDPHEAEGLAALYGVRLGMAPDCHTAELAALSTRPGSARVIDDVDSFLARLPLRFMRGIGLSEGNLTRLTWLGLRSVGDLAKWTPTQVRSYLAEEGEAVIPYVHGPRRTSLQPLEEPVTVSRTLAFTEPALEPGQLLPAIERLASELAQELSGRGARRLTLTASLPSGTRRASRLSKRPLTQARHIRQQALFALRDSRAEGQPIERLTLEVTAPERMGSQEGLWPRRERRQRALEAALERFPAAQRHIEWDDPHAQAPDRAWSWRAYAEDGGAYASASVADRRSPAVSGTYRPGHRSAPMDMPAAAAAEAVPLFYGAPAADTPPTSDVSAPAALPWAGTGAAAAYLDALFTGSLSVGATEGGSLEERADSGSPSARTGAQGEGGAAMGDAGAGALDQDETARRLERRKTRQRYSEDYELEAA